MSIDSSQHLASGKSGITMYPYYHWEVEVLLNQRPAVRFPIAVIAENREPVVQASWN